MEPKIPQFLVVGGVLGLIKFIVHLVDRIIKYKQLKKEHQQKDKHFNKIHLIFYSIDVVLILLFISIAIAGVFMVFGLNPNFENISDDKYCDKLAYHFAFALLAVFFIASIFAILTGFISVLVLCSIEKK